MGWWVQALWALAAVQKSLVAGRKQAASAIMSTLKKHCTKAYNRKLYDQFPNLCDQLIRLCNHQPPAKAKSVCLAPLPHSRDTCRVPGLFML